MQGPSTALRKCRTAVRGPVHCKHFLRSCIVARVLVRQQSTAQGQGLESPAPTSWRRPLVGPGSHAPPVWVALGKFDALHLGHRALATWGASRPGLSFLVSFSGMAAVLGWPARLPLVAPRDRPRILREWGEGMESTPQDFFIPFADVRRMTPEEFLQLLARDLGVQGVVVGSGFRFGYKAAGDTALLQRVGSELGMEIHIQELVGLSGQEVSSSAVRARLDHGDVAGAAELLGRPHRLCFDNGLPLELGSSHIWVPRTAMLNQPPARGRYACRLVDSNDASCTIAVSEDGLLVQPAAGQALPGAGAVDVDLLARVD